MAQKKHHPTHPAGPGLPLPIFHEPAFNEAQETVIPPQFLTPHPSDGKLYASLGNLLSTQTVKFDKSRAADGEVLELAAAYGDHGPQLIQQIQQAKQVVFHALGDSGAITAGVKFQNELNVTEQLSTDCHMSDAANHPAFLYHLGDVVYDFGEEQYYSDQFYDAFRNYPCPIFAIPGNHDSFITPGTQPANQPLTIFERNFCAQDWVITPEARSLHRTAMMQPGVYFTLDAPFVRIIGLFSNALEDPGVISSEKGKWAHVPDYQLNYLKAQLARIKNEKYAGAVLLAVHHPPFSYAPPPAAPGTGGNHGGSPRMLAQIDAICKQAGIYPHAVLSAHAHNYQRYTRTVKLNASAYDVPFVVCGDGGHNSVALTHAAKGKPSQEPAFGADVSYLDAKPAVPTGGLILAKYDDSSYGYLRITVDAQQLRIAYHQVGKASLAQSRFDLVTVDIKSHTIVAN
jgi:Calcineurin-like phosphoesterase